MSRTGREIFYCSRCTTRVRGVDFARGRAFKVRDHIYCDACRPVEPKSPPRSGGLRRAAAMIRRRRASSGVAGLLAVVLLTAATAFLLQKVRRVFERDRTSIVVVGRPK